MRLTGGAGVACVVEVGGSGTLAKSFACVGYGGKVSLIGVLTNARGGDTNPHGLMFRGASLHGIMVGSRAMFEDMLAAMTVNAIKPVIDKDLRLRGRSSGLPVPDGREALRQSRDPGLAGFRHSLFRNASIRAFACVAIA